MQFLFTLWNKFRAFLGLFVPVFARAGDFRSWGPGVWRTLHVIAVLVLLLVLYFLNRAYEGGVNQTFGLAPGPVRSYKLFLPMMGAALVALGWLLYWLLSLYGPADEAVEFADIHAAWTTGLKWLADEGVDPREVPMYLVLGKPAGGEDAFYRAAQFGLNIFAPNAGPVRFWANREVIFVSAPDACLLSALAERLPAGPADGQPADGIGPGITFGNVAQTINVGSMGSSFERLRELLAKKQDEGLTAEEEEEFADLSSGAAAPGEAVARSKTVLLSASERTRYSSRLRYLCRLMTAARSPVVPYNGAMLLIPWNALANDEQGKHLSELIRDEMTNLRSSMRLRAAHLVVVCDMEQAPGFREYSGRMPDEVRKQRFGQRLPIVPDQSFEESRDLYEAAAAHLGRRTLALGVMRALRPDNTERTPDGDAPTNRKLYYLYCESAERLPRLGRALKHGVPRPSDGPAGYDGPPAIVGVYLAATGREKWEQAFIHGLFLRVADESFQDAVGWTSDLLLEDQNYLGRSRYGYVAMTAIAAVCLAGAGFLILRSEG